MPDDDLLPAPEAAPAPASRTRHVALRQLFLDPNNYRFVDHPDYVAVKPEELTSEEVQRRTTGFLLGDGIDGVKDIIASLKKNGWLAIDHIQVREISKGKYLVVEGNRRVAALKHLQRRFDENAIDLGALTPGFFSSVPVVIYEEGNSAQHLVIMSLAHIAGKKKWPPLNQARALREFVTKHGWTEDETCQALGLERNALRLMLGALALSDVYTHSEFGDQMTTGKYSLFSEVVKSPALRTFIGWDRAEYRAENQRNLERLFSWFSRVNAPADDDDDDSASAPPSDAPISTATNVRELARLVHDEAALRALDESRRLSSATVSSSQLLFGRLTESIQRISDSVDELFVNSNALTQAHLSELEDVQRKVRGLLAARDRQPMFIGAPSERHPINTVRQSHFSEITIEHYRRFSGMTISGLRRVNIFVGANNSGKTSLLESIQILCAQNDITALLEIAQRRGKMYFDPPPGWLNEQIPEETRISGVFDSIPANYASVHIRRAASGEGVDDKTGYISSVRVASEYGGLQQRSATHLFEQRPRVTKFSSSKVLCAVAFSSPFTQHDSEFMTALFAKAVEMGLKKRVVAFIRTALDQRFIDVEQVSARYAQRFARFLVEHEAFPVAPDLAQFGEGLQRIFHIGLLFAYAKDGIVLIDEFESAIHVRLLVAFTKLIQELAVEFNVQVFVTSHSKECVDAFAKNGYRRDDVAAYTLRSNGPDKGCFRYSGEQLEALLEGFDFDPRD